MQDNLDSNVDKFDFDHSHVFNFASVYSEKFSVHVGSNVEYWH